MDRFTPIENSRFTPIEEPPVKFGTDYLSNSPEGVSKSEKFLKGAVDPIDAGAQMLTTRSRLILFHQWTGSTTTLPRKPDLSGKSPKAG